MRAAIAMKLFSKPTISQIKYLQELRLKKASSFFFIFFFYPFWLCKCLRVLEAGTFRIIFNNYTKTLLVPEIALTLLTICF